MNLKQLTNDQLRSLASIAARDANTVRQVVHRMRDLWEKKVIVISKKYKEIGPQTQALRQAYLDAEYFKAVDEYTDLLESGLKNRIQFETMCMMIKARQSERKNR